MKRKKTKKKGKGSLKYFYRFFIAFFGVFLILFLAGTFIKNKDGSICANSISCIKNLSGEYEKGKASGTFLGKSVSVPTEIAQVPIVKRFVLGDNALKKHIEVNLNTQHLYAFEGNNMVYSFPISSGKWAPTPTGVFNIWVKLRYTRMEGGNPADGTYYNLSNVPYVMFFYNDKIPKSRGFSLHGTYWHNNFGHPMSHGCVNMRTEDAAILYEWANPPTAGNMTYAKEKEGTQIIIYGVAPEE